MPSSVPFLSIDDRIKYLTNRGYIDPAASVSDEDVKRLAALNFHSFLGYAKNYRRLAAEKPQLIPLKTLPDLLHLADKDHEVSEALFRGLRQAEWRLRAVAVAELCAKATATDFYFSASSYREVESGSSNRLVQDVVSQIWRYGEPYVTKHIDQRCKELEWKRPDRYDAYTHDRYLDCVKDLPLWSTVDGLSLGTLSKIIARSTASSDTDEPAWKAIAEKLDIKRPVFLASLESLSVFRNAVAHHSRLWMRPTTVTSVKHRSFSRPLRDAHNKSMLVACANVAMFQEGAERADYLKKIQAIMDSEPVYRFGIENVFERTRTPTDR